jgi:hypothetical protein
MDTKLIEDTLDYIQHLEERCRDFDVGLYDEYLSLDVVPRLKDAMYAAWKEGQ